MIKAVTEDGFGTNGGGGEVVPARLSPNDDKPLEMPITSRTQTRHSTLYPRILGAGDTVKIVALSGDFELETAQATMKLVESLRSQEQDFRVEVDPVFSSLGQITRSSKERLRDLQESLFSDNVRVIWMSRGREDTNSLLEQLNPRLLTTDPKIFIGSGQTTMLLNAIYTVSGVVTFLGCEPRKPDWTMFMNSDRAERNFMQRFVQGTSQTLCPDMLVLRSGRASGHFIGGDIGEFCALNGTKYFPSTQGALLLLEGRFLNHDALRNHLFHLRATGHLHHLGGLIVGQIHQNRPALETNAQQFDPKGPINQIILDATRDLRFPIVRVNCFGRSAAGTFFPIGGRGSICTDNQTIFIDSACQSPDVELPDVRRLAAGS